ncbi:hypothetical protein [Natronorubrum bangense]|uniref:Uncharacterized protein n=2 Tax=Natronorubrum bangense TaxID=61858 RepID=L9WK95_9EURY|nr:hypothetical protein [Natronorubrum bangense]ELY49874.1 hypothetical protein C494_07685 [Natronorubrum bangense JCM 10635]QCC55493.1 hypothetical protein DV706_14060 [Natronorubrum bangense]
MKPQYLEELFNESELTTIPGGYQVPVLAKNPLAAQFEVPPREVVISDLLGVYPEFEYEQVAYMVAAIFGNFDLDEVEFVDRIENEATIVAPSDLGVILN